MHGTADACDRNARATLAGMTDVASRAAHFGGRLLGAAAGFAASPTDPEARTIAAEALLREVAAACQASGARLHVAAVTGAALEVAVGSLAEPGPAEGRRLVELPVHGVPRAQPAPAARGSQVTSAHGAPPSNLRPDRESATTPKAPPTPATPAAPPSSAGHSAPPASSGPSAQPSSAMTAPGESGPWLGTLWLDDPRRDSGEIVRLLGLSLQVDSSAAALAYADRRFAALDDAIRAMTSLLAVDRVLQAIVDRARELIGSRYAALGISDVDGTIEQFITSGMSRTERALVGAPPHGRGILGAIMREAGTIRLADVASDPRRVGFPANHPVMHAFLGVPVRVRGRIIGNLYLTEKEGGFTDEDVRVVEAFAGHAGIAMENARLHEQVQRLAVVEERERIGRDLHDGIIQAIYAVGLSLEDVPDMLEGEPDEARRRVERAIDSLDQTIRDIRNFIFGLRPQLLEGVRLVEGLDALADEFRVNTMIDIDLRVGPDARDVAISPTRTLELLAIVREGLSNVARHARATQATITVLPEVNGPGLVLELADNGVGFDPAAARSGSHQGLRNIRGRAAAIEAELDIDSRVGAGTRIIVRVPPDRAEETPGEDDERGTAVSHAPTGRDADASADPAEHGQQGGSSRP